MGREGDPDAALDTRLRVRGVRHLLRLCSARVSSPVISFPSRPFASLQQVRGLRVADASAWPCVTSGNTNVPAMMTGDKAGELILHDHGLLEGAAAAARSRL